MNAHKANQNHGWRATAAFVAILVGAPAMANANAEFRFTGNANGVNTQYREEHRVQGVCYGNQFKPQSHRIEYFDASSDSPFASKQLRYDRDNQPSLLRPEVEFVQPRFNERLTVGYDS
ncbi:MAG TPA: hypothetical protein VGP45_05825, partial [Marinobacter sp.]|nr:hypothetical protein [Marinobacter sp.]